MHALHLADKLRIELLSGQTQNARKLLPQELLERLLEIVRPLNDSIEHLQQQDLLQQELLHTPDSKKRPHAYQFSRRVKDRPLCSERKRHHSKVGEALLVREGYDDSFIWRKYGRKPINGQKHPRHYYKCVHKEDLSCPAIKRMQQCEGDANLFEVTYIGTHTCEGTSDARTHHSLLSPPHVSTDMTESFASHDLGPSPNATGDSHTDRVNVAMGVESSSYLFPLKNNKNLHFVLEEEMSYASLEDAAEAFQDVEQQSEMNALFASSSNWVLDFDTSNPAFLDFKNQF